MQKNLEIDVLCLVFEHARTGRRATRKDLMRALKLPLAELRQITQRLEARGWFDAGRGSLTLSGLVIAASAASARRTEQRSAAA